MAGWNHGLDGVWVWVNSGSWWWTGRPGVLRFMDSQRVGHAWARELNWRITLSNTLLAFSFLTINQNVIFDLAYFFFHPQGVPASGSSLLVGEEKDIISSYVLLILSLFSNCWFNLRFGQKGWKQVRIYIAFHLLSRVQLFATPQTIAHQAPLSVSVFQN